MRSKNRKKAKSEKQKIEANNESQTRDKSER
jgi:hypothetical protein